YCRNKRQTFGTRLSNAGERCIKVPCGPYLERLELEAERTGGPLAVVKQPLSNIGRVEFTFYKKCDPGSGWHKRLEQFEPLRDEFQRDIRYAREVPPWSSQARDKTASHWLANIGKDDRDRCRRLL